MLKLILDTFCDGREGRHKEGYLAVWSGARAVGSVFVTCTSPIIYLPPPPEILLLIYLGHYSRPREIDHNAYAIFFQGGGEVGGKQTNFVECAS